MTIGFQKSQDRNISAAIYLFEVVLSLVLLLPVFMLSAFQTVDLDISSDILISDGSHL